MKYTAADSFHADYAALSSDEQAMFRRPVRQINDAYDRRGARAIPQWPTSLRVKSVRGHSGIWEMTWSFSGPDGRATFELVEIDDEPAIKWHRIGSHRIFDRP